MNQSNQNPDHGVVKHLPTAQNAPSGGSNMLPAAYFPTESDWRMLTDIGAKAYSSGLLPTAIKNATAATIIALKARELGIPVMMGFAHIYVIEGKPSMSSEMMQALARRNLPGLIINILQSTHEIAEIEFIRPERGARPFKLSFSIEDARRADLLKKDVWRKYPGAMLWSRAISAGLRKVCPEALMGVSYTPEELGAEVTEDGKVIETTGKTIAPKEGQQDQGGQSSSPPGAPQGFRFDTPHFQALKSACDQSKRAHKEIFEESRKLFGISDLRKLDEKQYYQLLTILQPVVTITPVEMPVQNQPIVEEVPDSLEPEDSFAKAPAGPLPWDKYMPTENDLRGK